MNSTPPPVIANPATARAAVKMLTGSQTGPRLAMRGASMLPLLREPMVLQLGPASARDRIGDILVFERDQQLVAHRITDVRGGRLQTCGDALPWSPEYPERDCIVGKVVAVFAHAGEGAARVDTRFFRLRGTLVARLRASRAIAFHLRTRSRALAHRMYRAIVPRPGNS
jgi:hypothetical protein